MTTPESASAAPAGAAELRCVRALLRRELGAGWAAAVLLSAAAAAYVAHGTARAGLFGATTPQAASPILSRLVDFPATLAGAVALAAALLAIVRVNEDRTAGWFAPLAVADSPRSAYPLALVASVCAALLPIFVMGAGTFEVVKLLSTGSVAVAGTLPLQGAVAAAACAAFACYGIGLAVLLRGTGAAALVGVALYAVPIVPAVLAATAGDEPVGALRVLALPLPAPAISADGAVLLRHLLYAALALAGLVALADFAFGRWK
jgi:hypothetical protein